MVLALLSVAACAAAPVPVNYAPSSVMSSKGSTGVAQFTYPPADPGVVNHVDANQIRNTAMGDIHIDREVRVFVRDAVFAELRLTGVKTDDMARLLTGEIQEFLIDDLGYSVDWTLRIKYRLVESSTRRTVFEGVKNTQRKTAKFANPFGALNETIKLNAEALMMDPGFRQAIDNPAAPLAAQSSN
jgi:uncharacterized lipoprotein